MILDCPGATTLQYDEVNRLAGITESNLPDGLLFHSCTQTDAGIVIVDVWDSEEKFHEFGSIIMPIIHQIGIQPEVRIGHTHNIFDGRASAKG